MTAHRSRPLDRPPRSLPPRSRSPGRSLLAVLTLSTACATTERPPPRVTVIDDGALSVALELAPGARAFEEAIRRALPFVVERLARHGLTPTTRPLVRLHDDVGSFVRATGQTGPHLRAWATYDTVDLAPIDTWRVQTERALVERLTHELCHVALYQALGDEDDARALAPPFFFDEGTCSVVADQGASRAPIEVLKAHFVDENPLADPTLARASPALAYGASHWASAALRDAYGPTVFRDVAARVARTPTATKSAVADDPSARHALYAAALSAETGLDLAALWMRVITPIGPSSDVSTLVIP